jgi:hypothetical protein
MVSHYILIFYLNVGKIKATSICLLVSVVIIVWSSFDLECVQLLTESIQIFGKVSKFLLMFNIIIRGFRFKQILSIKLNLSCIEKTNSSIQYIWFWDILQHVRCILYSSLRKLLFEQFTNMCQTFIRKL